MVFREPVADDELVHVPGVQAGDRQVEACLEGGRLLGQRDEYEAVPFGQGQRVEA